MAKNTRVRFTLAFEVDIAASGIGTDITDYEDMVEINFLETNDVFLVPTVTVLKEETAEYQLDENGDPVVDENGVIILPTDYTVIDRSGS